MRSDSAIFSTRAPSCSFRSGGIYGNMLESMELEEKKVPHDFLSLYAADSSFEPEDPRSASRGSYLKTRDFLQPLDGREQGGGRNGEKAVTGGADTSSIGHSGDASVRMGDAQPDATPVPDAMPIGLEAKPEPDYGSWSTTTSYGSYAGVPYGLWDDKTAVCREQWPSPFIGTAHGNGTGAISTTITATSSQRCLTPEMKGTLEVATSRSSQVHKEVDDDAVFGKRECSSSRTDMTIKVHGRGSSVNEPRPTTPRSKHSATEQRRRTKINDRFQTLRQIIPDSEQKRDKASFLMEVIEYIRFLQEKVQRYEAPCSTRDQDAAKLIPWKSSQTTANDLSIPPEVIKADPAAPHLFSANCIDGISPVTVRTSVKLSSPTTGTQNQDSMRDRPLLISSSRVQEQLIIDDGTISISNTYSHGLLNTLAQALQSSGVDLSHAGISVQINLGKRALRRTTASSSTSNFKGEVSAAATSNYAILQFPCSLRNNIEQFKAPKRSRLENS